MEAPEGQLEHVDSVAGQFLNFSEEFEALQADLKEKTVETDARPDQKRLQQLYGRLAEANWQLAARVLGQPLVIPPELEPASQNSISRRYAALLSANTERLLTYTTIYKIIFQSSEVPPDAEKMVGNLLTPSKPAHNLLRKNSLELIKLKLKKPDSKGFDWYLIAHRADELLSENLQRVRAKGHRPPGPTGLRIINTAYQKSATNTLRILELKGLIQGESTSVELGDKEQAALAAIQSAGLAKLKELGYIANKRESDDPLEDLEVAMAFIIQTGAADALLKSCSTAYQRKVALEQMTELVKTMLKHFDTQYKA